jgi:hypothetical protein
VKTPERPPSGLRRLASAYDRRRGRAAVIISWLLTRALMIAILVRFESFVVGDVFYYHRKIAELFDVGLAGTLTEYPTPVVWILWLPYGSTGGSATGYLVAFMAFMMLLDAIFTVALYRTGGRRHDGAIDFWVLFVFLLGPLCYLRFDMLPAVLAGGALLAARRRPWLTGALTGLGAAVKLWPALLIAAFGAHRPDRKPAVWAFVAVGFGLAGLSLITGGWTRLVSPLTWQSGRGLQVESIWATPLMLARAFSPGWRVDFSRFQAYEIFGPGVEVWLLISNIATLLGLVALVLLWILAYRAPEVSPVTVGLIVLSTVAIMTVTNKTLSPQYLLWLGGPMAALLLLRRSAAPAEQIVVNRLASQLLVLALLTQLVYPLLYDGLLGFRGDAMVAVATVVTAIRNLALLLFTVEVCRLTWRFLAGDGSRYQSPTGTKSSLA